MKEQSIEEKAKAYDEAFNVALETYQTQPMYKNWLEKMFPELKESEDEKIRSCIGMCLTDIDEQRFIDFNTNLKECLAWLEKQGEQKSEEVDNLHNYLYSEQKHKSNIAPIFKVGDIIKNKKNGDTVKVEQILSDSYCYSGWDGAATIHSDFLISDQGNWELVEQKPWSEEDEKRFRTIISDGIRGAKFDTPQIDWLKSLKERCTWKPSDEQMAALKYVVNLMASSESLKENDFYYNVFKDLRKQLKKLREE